MIEMISRFKAAVSEVTEKFTKEYIKGIGQEAEFEEHSRGWFVKLSNSYESIFVGFNKPSISIGDIVTITLEFPDANA